VGRSHLNHRAVVSSEAVAVAQHGAAGQDQTNLGSVVERRAKATSAAIAEREGDGPRGRFPVRDFAPSSEVEHIGHRALRRGSTFARAEAYELAHR
jgi:hypothetical protein